MSKRKGWPDPIHAEHRRLYDKRKGWPHDTQRQLRKQARENVAARR